MIVLCALRGTGRAKQAIWLFTGLVVAVLGYAVLTKAGVRFLDIFSGQALEGRGVIWATSMKMAFDHFLTGTGLGTFYLYYPANRIAALDNSAGQWAHMDSLQLFVETGIAAPVLLYALAASVIFAALKAAPFLEGEEKVYFWGTRPAR